MAETHSELVRRYLQEAILAEKGFEAQLHGFATDGDDDEVQNVFAAHADETRSQQERLRAQFERLQGSSSGAKTFLTHLADIAPKISHASDRPEERTVQNLILAFTIESGECALYDFLAVIARAAGDYSTETLARTIQAEEQRMAERIWHFITSRTKIAFNMLTLDEVDVAVRTKAANDRIVNR